MNETKTYKKLKDKPQDNFPEWIVVHHGGGTNANPLADTSNHTAKDMEEWHLSLGWEGLGYQYVIEKDGDVWKGRPEHYHGAHTVDYNYKSIGICLSGNFDATLPTDAQINALKTILGALVAKYKIPLQNIVPHRKFAQKTCYGRKLDDFWAKNLISTPDKETVKKEIHRLVDLL